MNHYSLSRSFKIFLVFTCFYFSGCTTSALLKEAKGQVNEELKYGVIKINSAYKDDSSKVVHVCMNVMDMDMNKYIEREVTLDIPLNNQKRWSVNPLLNNYGDIGGKSQPSANLSGAFLGFRPSPKDLSLDCLNRGRQIPVFNVNTVISPYGSEQNQEKLSFRLPAGESEAIYAISSGGFTTNFGYVSARPIIEHSYAINVSADDLMDVRSMKNQKPYLYILTPVTLAIDATTVALGVAVEAVFLYVPASFNRYPTDNGGSVIITP